MKTKPPLPGEVVVIKGKWGQGVQVTGDLFCLEKAGLFDLKEEYRDQVLALKTPLTKGVWHKAKSLGAKGIICGGLAEKELKEEIEKEVLRVGGEEKRISLPLVVLGGEGQMPEEFWSLLKKNQGKKIAIEGDRNRILVPK